jgi:hypothetical protein
MRGSRRCYAWLRLAFCSPTGVILRHHLIFGKPITFVGAHSRGRKTVRSTYHIGHRSNPAIQPRPTALNKPDYHGEKQSAGKNQWYSCGD